MVGAEEAEAEEAEEAEEEERGGRAWRALLSAIARGTETQRCRDRQTERERRNEGRSGDGRFHTCGAARTQEGPSTPEDDWQHQHQHHLQQVLFVCSGFGLQIGSEFFASDPIFVPH